MKPITPARMYKTKLRAGCGWRGRKEHLHLQSEHRCHQENRITNTFPTNLKSDENGAGTDGEGNHSHEGTHDEVRVKDLALQRDVELKNQQHLQLCNIQFRNISTADYHRVTQLLWERIFDLHGGFFWCSVLKFWEYFRPDQ